MKNEPQHDVAILSNCTAADKQQLLAQLAEKAASMRYLQACGLQKQEILDHLIQREMQSPTELGSGLFFPHARLKNVPGLTVLFAALEKPIAAELEPETPLKIICMMLIPEEAPMSALTVLSHITGYLQKPGQTELFFDILRRGDIEAVHAILQNDQREAAYALTLIRPWRCHITPETPLREATVQMQKCNEPVAPVLSEDGKLLGELSCTALFQLGIPDFFTHLKSVGFIRYFDPFVNYFERESGACAKDVMKTDVPRFSTDATLIEIVFAMTVQHIPLLYITDGNDRLLGVIDQTVLLDRIVNL